MATLPELVATPVTITLKGNTFTGIPLTLLKVADVLSGIESVKTEKGEGYANVLSTVRFVGMFLTQAGYENVNDDYVARLINGEDAEVLTAAINQIGGFDPKAPTGEPSLSESSTEPVGDPAISQV